MKKCWIILVIFLSISVQSSFAQSDLNSFFERNGTVSLQTAEMDALADTMALLNHRKDDIVWSRTVYRIIDLRDKQNYQLYFPVIPNEQYKSLFRLIVDAIVNDTLKAYGKIERDILPNYKELMSKDSLSNIFVSITNDTVNRSVTKEQLIVQDPITQKLAISNFLYKAYVKDQYKFLIQELVFFDKHTSRMYTKIIGIAPMYGLTESNISLGGNNDAWSYLQSSVLCWFLFDELRPYLARHYVIPNGNDTQRMTFDDFFTQHLYSSYVLGDSNNRGWMLLRQYTNADKIKKEQQRIETEILNFEQDLWEY